MDWHKGLLTASRVRAGTPCRRALGEASSPPRSRPAELPLPSEPAGAQGTPTPAVRGGSIRPGTDPPGKPQVTWLGSAHPMAQHSLSKDALEKLALLTRNPRIQGEKVRVIERKEGNSDGSRRGDLENHATAEHNAPLVCLQLSALTGLQGCP